MYSAYCRIIASAPGASDPRKSSGQARSAYNSRPCASHTGQLPQSVETCHFARSTPNRGWATAWRCPWTTRCR